MLDAELPRIDGKDVAVERTRGVARISFQDAHAGNLAEGFVHVGSHLFSHLRLGREALDADQRQGSLQLAQAVVGAHQVFAGVVFGSAAQGMRATAVDDAGSFGSQLGGAAEQDAALAAGEDLGRLQAEGAEVTDGAGALAAPLWRRGHGRSLR